MNYFDWFGLQADYLLDLTELKQRYQQLQKRFHPDNYGASPDSERLLAVQKAAQINDAYQTLKDPLRRAEYLLQLRGVALPEQAQSFADSDFLMQQMALRERLAEVEEATDPLAALDVLDAEVAALKHDYQQQLNACMASDDKALWQQAGDIVRKLKFVNKLQQEIAAKEEQLDD